MTNDKKEVAVYGAGNYVGKPVSELLAKAGPDLIKTLHLYDPDLDRLDTALGQLGQVEVKHHCREDDPSWLKGCALVVVCMPERTGTDENIVQQNRDYGCKAIDKIVQFKALDAMICVSDLQKLHSSFPAMCRYYEKHAGESPEKRGAPENRLLGSIHLDMLANQISCDEKNDEARKQCKDGAKKWQRWNGATMKFQVVGGATPETCFKLQEEDKLRGYRKLGKEDIEKLQKKMKELVGMRSLVLEAKACVRTAMVVLTALVPNASSSSMPGATEEDRGECAFVHCRNYDLNQKIKDTGVEFMCLPVRIKAESGKVTAIDFVSFSLFECTTLKGRELLTEEIVPKIIADANRCP